MKSFQRTFTLILLLGILVKCDEDEVTSRVYPRIKTLPVTEITSKGAKFNAEIIFRGDFEILSYGFAWDKSENPDTIASQRVIFLGNLQATKFSAEIKTTLQENIKYFIRPFLITKDFTVYGNNLSFLSLGSSAPIVSTFSPTSGTWGDTLTINGDYFSFVNEDNIVKLGDVKAEVLASSDTLVKIKVPTVKNNNIVKLSVTIFGNITEAEQMFNYLIPEVSNVTPITATFNDTLSLKGKNFSKVEEYNAVSFNGVVAAIASSDVSQINVVVPEGLTVKESTIKLTSAGHELIHDQKFTLKPPLISSFDPDSALIPNEVITISGSNFNPIKANNLVVIDGFDAEVIMASNNTLQVILPDKLIPFRSISVFKNASISITVAEQTDTTTDPLEIFWQSTWTRKSDFPGIERTDAVSFALNGKGYYGTGFNLKDSHIFNHIMLNDFWEYDPVTDQWTRIIDFPGSPRKDAVAFAINEVGYVGLGTDYPEDDTGHFKDFFKYDPNLKTWSSIASYGGVGRHSAAAFVINGKGHVGTGWWGRDNPNGTGAVSDNIWQYDPLTNSWTEISKFPRHTYFAAGFSINNQGYIYDYDALYKLDGSEWIRLTSFRLNSWDIVAFSIGNYGYYGIGNFHTWNLIEYDPLNQQWTDFRLRFPGSSGASVFVINNKAYIIGGMSYTTSLYELWVFDPTLHNP